MHRVALEHGTAPGWAFLRDLRGEDEESVEGTESESVIALLDRLLIDAPGAVVGPGQAEEIAVPDRDRLLAAVYLGEIGPRVQSTMRCAQCDKPFDLDFELEALIDSVAAGAPAGAAVRETGGVYRLPDGRRFRLPRGVDERAVAGVAAERAELELLSRCMVEGSVGDGVASLTEAMRAVGPLLDLDVNATCPECGYEQSVRFDLQHYLLSEIVAERPGRMLEIHRIAVAYGWSRAEILGLTRRTRRMHVDIIEREAR